MVYYELDLDFAMFFQTLGQMPIKTRGRLSRQQDDTQLDPFPVAVVSHWSVKDVYKPGFLSRSSASNSHQDETGYRIRYFG